MPDVPESTAPEPDPEFADKLVALRDRLDDAARIALTGDTHSRVRRKLLFAIAEVGAVVALVADGVVSLIFGTLGLLALLLLAMTDDVVTFEVSDDR